MVKETWCEKTERELDEEMTIQANVMFSMPSHAGAYDCEKMTDTIIDEHPMCKSVEKTMDEQIDELEVMALNDGVLVDCPLDHVFTPGIYTRTILMQAGAVVTSMVHKEEHQYIVSQGSALVKIGYGQWRRISAPFKGITKAGTRRVLYIESECIWTTVHATNVYPISDKEEDLAAAVELVEDQIFVKRENTLLGGFVKGNKVIKNIDKWQDGQQQS